MAPTLLEGIRTLEIMVIRAGFVSSMLVTYQYTYYTLVTH
jgi:hypothetical protein